MRAVTRLMNPVHSTRGTLMLMLVVVLLPLLFVQGLIFWNWYTTRMAREKLANHEYAVATGELFEAYVRDVSREARSIGYALTMQSFPQARTERLLSRCAADYPSLYHINWLNPAGRVLASSTSQALGIDLVDRDYYQRILHGSKDIVVSDLLISRTNAMPAFVIAQGIRNDAGRLQGIVTAVVNPEKLAQVALPQQRVEGGAYTILDRNGRAVFHSIEQDMRWDERNWQASTPQLATALAGVPVTGTFPWGVDRQERVTSIVPIDALGWAAAASRPRTLVLAPVLRSLFRSLFGLLFVTAISVLCALLLARYLGQPISRLRDVAAAFGQGNYDIRAVSGGPHEIQALAMTFNEMTEQIQAQQEELVAQNEELQAQQEELAAQNEELQAQQEELAAQNEELHAQQEELAAQNEELHSQQEEVTAANSELQRVSDALEIERAFLAGAVDILPMPILFYTPDSEVLLANSACQDLLGDENLMQLWHDQQFLRMNTRAPIPGAERPLQQIIAGGDSASLEALYMHSDGREIPVLLQAAPIRKDGQLVAIAEIMQDISWLKEEDRAKNEFLAVLSHELLTPVTSMLGWAQIAREPSTSPGIVTQALEVIERNARRQKRLVDDLLDVSRIIHGKLALNPETIDLNELVHQQAESAQQDAKNRQIRLSVSPANEPVPIYADPLRTAQVISNLLNNALKFTEADGAISLACVRTGNVARLIVQDTGRGVPPDKLADLFNPFHQLNRNEAAGGLGLGLALVKGIVELQGGTVSAFSAGEGQGSRFCVEIPIHAD